MRYVCCCAFRVGEERLTHSITHTNRHTNDPRATLVTPVKQQQHYIHHSEMGGRVCVRARPYRTQRWRAGDWRREEETRPSWVAIITITNPPNPLLYRGKGRQDYNSLFWSIHVCVRLYQYCKSINAISIMISGMYQLSLPSKLENVWNFPELVPTTSPSVRENRPPGISGLPWRTREPDWVGRRWWWRWYWWWLWCDGLQTTTNAATTIINNGMYAKRLPIVILVSRI